MRVGERVILEGVKNREPRFFAMVFCGGVGLGKAIKK